jgi:hypothetical protein
VRPVFRDRCVLWVGSARSTLSIPVFKFGRAGSWSSRIFIDLSIEDAWGIPTPGLEDICIRMWREKCGRTRVAYDI